MWAGRRGSRPDRSGGCGAAVSTLTRRLDRSDLSIVRRIVRSTSRAVDREAKYLTFLGMQEHGPAGATGIVNRVLARDDGRWSLGKRANRRRWNDRETYLWVHGLTPGTGPPHGALPADLRATRQARTCTSRTPPSVQNCSPIPSRGGSSDARHRTRVSAWRTAGITSAAHPDVARQIEAAGDRVGTSRRPAGVRHGASDHPESRPCAAFNSRPGEAACQKVYPDIRYYTKAEEPRRRPRGPASADRRRDAWPDLDTHRAPTG
jgi:hypothetical protein